MTDYEGFKKLKEYITLKGSALKKLTELYAKTIRTEILEAELEADEEDSYTPSLYNTYINSTIEKGVDILFLLDLTSSMGPFIKMTKESIYSGIDFVRERYSKSITRFGFVGYRDFCDQENKIVKMDFTSDFEGIKALIGS